MMCARIVHSYGHYLVYINDEFYCTADTEAEAISEIEEYKEMMA